MDIFLIHDNSDRRFRKLVIKFISSTANVVPRKSRVRVRFKLSHCARGYIAANCERTLPQRA